MKKYVDMVGAEAVIAITTDNAANLKAARTKLVSRPGYKHIITGRCVWAQTETDPQLWEPMRASWLS